MKRRLLAGVVTCAVVASVGGGAPAALAELVPDAATAGALEGCAEFFAATDPAGLWKRMNDPNGPKVIIEKTDADPDGSGTGTSVRNGEVIIDWDPTHDINKDGITAGPCEALYHELQHAADDSDKIPRKVLDEKCNKINNAEWRAVAAENALRRAMGLPERKSYNGQPFGYGSFDECKKDQQNPKPPPKKQSNSAFGDPHVTTTDGLIYDLQQVGEFTAFTSNDAGAPKVQLRTAAVPDSPYASMVTGTAAGTGDQRIAFVLDNGRLTITHGQKNETIAVDQGSEKDLGGGMTVSAAEAGEIFVGSAHTVRWSDGSELNVDESGFWGLRVSFTPSDQAKAASPKGLFGTFNGDPADDLTRPDGKVVPVDSPDDVIRSQFGDAWRISQGDSLFPYGPGQSTESLTDRKFPSAQPRFPAAVTDQATRACRVAGVGQAILAACVFDVSVTGNPALARTAADVSAETTVTAVAGQPLNAKGFGPGLAVSGAVRTNQPVTYEFTAKAGDVANIRSACTPTGKGLTYSVVAIDGHIGDYLGYVDGCSDLGRVAFAATGRYKLDIVGDGQYGITWQTTPGDAHRDLDRATTTAGHLAAGTRHYYRFTVAPGQTWTFTPDGACTQVNGFTWAVVDATGSLNDRGIPGGCDVIGPLTLGPGQYDVKIDAAGSDVDYAFTTQVS